MSRHTLRAVSKRLAKALSWVLRSTYVLAYAQPVRPPAAGTGRLCVSESSHRHPQQLRINRFQSARPSLCERILTKTPPHDSGPTDFSIPGRHFVSQSSHNHTPSQHPTQAPAFRRQQKTRHPGTPSDTLNRLSSQRYELLIASARPLPYRRTSRVPVISP